VVRCWSDMDAVLARYSVWFTHTPGRESLGRSRCSMAHSEPANRHVMGIGAGVECDAVCYHREMMNLTHKRSHLGAVLHQTL